MGSKLVRADPDLPHVGSAFRLDPTINNPMRETHPSRQPCTPRFASRDLPSMHGTGVLLIQLGTPDAPTADGPAPLPPPVPRRPPRHRRARLEVGWLILNLFILPCRPGALRRQVRPHLGPDRPARRCCTTRAARSRSCTNTCRHVPVAFGMQVGNPPSSPSSAR